MATDRPADSDSPPAAEPSRPLRVVVLARDRRDHIQAAWDELDDVLAAEPGVEVVAAEACDDFDCTTLDADDFDCDLVVVIGGDGAILRACRLLAERQRPIIGINLGRLGFLADLSLEQFKRRLPAIARREYRVTRHLMFECRHKTADGEARHLGLNEVVLYSAGSLRIIDIELEVDDRPVTTYSGDGLILATPVGSTAHSLSAGGPVIRQDLDAFVITPICPHTLTIRPLVDSADCIYRMRVPNAADGVKLIIDGQTVLPIGPRDEVEIRRAPVAFQLARVEGHSFYQTLHRKLGWHGQPRYRDRKNPPGLPPNGDSAAGEPDADD